MTGYDNEMIDQQAYSDDERPDDDMPPPEPGNCPYCRRAIRFIEWTVARDGRTGHYNCSGCGCNWGSVSEIAHDRNAQLPASEPITAAADSAIDEHLAAVDAAELWAGEPPF